MNTIVVLSQEDATRREDVECEERRRFIQDDDVYVVRVRQADEVRRELDEDVAVPISRDSIVEEDGNIEIRVQSFGALGDRSEQVS